MFRKFLKDESGNYALMTAVAIVPILAGLGLAVDYSALLRQRAEVQNAVDASCVATGRRVVDGATNAQLIQYAEDFFNSNLKTIDPADTDVEVTLPDSDSGGGILTVKANFTFEPKVMGVWKNLPNLSGLYNRMIGDSADSVTTSYDMPIDCQLRLKNTSEVALVLDNSGSMDNYGGGSSKKRITLLKDAAKYLVQELARQSSKIKQVSKPVQFSVVPFSASVNIGPENAIHQWMDHNGVSPIHHENFDWSKMTEARKTINATPDGLPRWVEKVDGVWYKRGEGWGDTEDLPATRFSVYGDMKYYSTREVTGTEQQWQCTKKSGNTCIKGKWVTVNTYSDTNPLTFADWQGCVEERPYPYNVDDSTPTAAVPATLFVPMFAPDESGNLWSRDLNGDGDTSDADEFASNSNGYGNSWWADFTNTNLLASNESIPTRQKDMQKYFQIKPYGSTNPQSGDGPNFSCTTSPITPLTDVTETVGMNKIIAAIDAMAPTGMTNVPDGMAWGWRTVSSGEPFTEGRPETEKGNDKVLIVLTDGMNTYSDLNDGDAAGNKSTYASYGYTGVGYNGTSTTRMYMGTSSNVSKSTFSSSNYTKAMTEHMDQLCANAKAAKIKVFTVALDLNTSSDAAAIASLQACASESKFRKNANGTYKKLFWNTTGADLLDVFKTIADELSNLRIVG